VTPLSERDWQAQVLELARLYRWRIHHCRPAMRPSGRWSTPIQGDPGFPDLVLARSGRIVFIELKTNRGVLDANQAAWRDALIGTGAEWFCWRPRHLDEVRETLSPWRDADWRDADPIDLSSRDQGRPR